jgi:hypothetical protein
LREADEGAFSTRRQSLVEHMEAMGTSGFAAARVAALATRERKEHVDLAELREAWIARAAEMGLGADELRGVLGREPAERDPTALDAAAITADLLTAHQTTFTSPEIVCAVAGAARDGATVGEGLEATEGVAEGPGVVRVGDAPTPGRPERFTARGLLDLEREAL